MTPATSGRLAFIDVEASSLSPNSYPIEMGWAILGGGSGAMLISPGPDWPRDDWDELAESQHGITWEELQGQGTAVETVATQLNALIPLGSLGLTDAFEWDGFWIERLFDATSQTRQFQLGSFWHSLALAADVRSILSEWEEESNDLPRRHRAQADAERLRRIWIRATLSQS